MKAALAKIDAANAAQEECLERQAAKGQLGQAASCPDGFDVVLFVFDARGAEEFLSEAKGDWVGRSLVVFAEGQFKRWFAGRFLPASLTAGYDYIFVWDDDMQWEPNFLPANLTAIMRRYRVELAQPAVLDHSPWEPYMKLHPWPTQPGCWVTTPYARST